MKEGYLAALAVIGMAAILYAWGGPQGQDGGGYRAAYAGQQRPNCLPRNYRAAQTRPVDYDDDGGEYEQDPRWQRVQPRQTRRPEYPETDSRDAGVTTAFRRSE